MTSKEQYIEEAAKAAFEASQHHPAGYPYEKTPEELKVSTRNAVKAADLRRSELEVPQKVVEAMKEAFAKGGSPADMLQAALRAMGE